MFVFKNKKISFFSRSAIFFFSIFFIGTLVGCGFFSEKTDPAREPSGFNSDFVFDTNQSFENYIVDARENIIKKGRLDLDSEDAKRIVDWNAPFILVPPKSCDASKKTEKKRGLLLIHGLSDSPFGVKSLGEHFQKKCFTVYAILLTGHGTRPGDLLQVSYKSWRKQVRYAAAKLKEKVDQLYLGGYSTGGVLALDYAVTNEDVEGLILIAPAFVLPFAARFAGIVKHFRSMVSWKGNSDVAKYESLTMNGVAQLDKLLTILDDELSKKSLPIKNIKVFSVISYEDTTIKAAKSIDYLLKHIDPEKSRTVVYYQRGSVLPDRFLNKENIIPIVSTIDEKNILSFSHLSLLHHMTNQWYGINGSYRNCLHYEKDSEDYTLCENLKHFSIGWGENTKENLSKEGVMARITFNPMLEDLFFSMDQFFGN